MSRASTACIRDELLDGEKASVIVKGRRRFCSTLRLTARWATNPQPRQSFFRKPRGRLCQPDRLRRSRWRRSRQCTNIPPGPLNGG